MMVLCMSVALCTILTLSEAASLNSSVLITPIPRGLCAQSNPAPIGAYVPQCDSNGNFLPQQCWASSGYCWCVNILTGKEIKGTRTPPGTTPVDCGYFGNVENNFCPTGWSRYGDRCFIFIDTTKTWAEAEAYCVFEGANLASVHSSEENRFIQGLTRGDTHDFPITWIGGQDAIQNGLWMWSDGSVFDYKNWYNGQGVSGGEPCLYMNYGAEFLWNDYVCTYRYPFVCAKRISTLN